MIYHDGSDDFLGLAAAVEKTVENLKPHIRKFDSIIVTGISGQCVGIPVALALKKEVCVLRKKGDSRHGSDTTLVNRKQIGKRALFLDDFISGGSTRERCREAATREGARICGSYLYKNHVVTWHRKTGGQILKGAKEGPYL